jgi:hypothetical protein
LQEIEAPPFVNHPIDENIRRECELFVDGLQPGIMNDSQLFGIPITDPE